MPYLQVCWFFLLPVQINCWAPLVQFSFYFTFKSRIFTWFFFVVVISLLIFSIWWNIVSIPSSIYLSIILFDYLKVVIMAALKLFCVKSNISASHKHFLAWLVSSLWVTLYCFFMSLSLAPLPLSASLSRYCRLYLAASVYWFHFQPFSRDCLCCCFLVNLIRDLAGLR